MDFKHPEKFPIIKEILEVRKMEESYKRNAIGKWPRPSNKSFFIENESKSCLDASTVVHVVDRRRLSNGNKDADLVTKLEPTSKPEKRIRMKKIDLNPSPSVAQETPFSTESSDMSVPTTGEDRNQFNESERPDRLYVTPSNNYYSDYSNAFIEASTTQELNTPVEQTSINRLAQAPFPDASSAEHYLTAAPSQNFVSQYAPWPSSYRETYFIPQDYRSTASHGMSETFMYYPVGITPNSESVAQPPTPGCWVVPALPTQPGANQGWGH